MKQWTTTEIKEMTVLELIDKTKFRVKLGAKNGSGFVYCGRIDKLDIETLDKLIQISYRDTIARAEATINTLTKKPKSYKAFSEEMMKKKNARVAKYIKQNGDKPLTEDQKVELEEEFTISRLYYNRWLGNINRKLETAKTTKKLTTRRLNNYTTIKNRSIVDCYPSVLEEGVTIVIYDGDERGPAWTTEEYESGYIDY